ncbi:MAG: hypothetical protein JW754_02690 [Candidatus Aenigmarchaeota archaeon]|nr:hypothetical protein [Candidatus Aenigmarchaeota archaeon]
MSKIPSYCVTVTKESGNFGPSDGYHMRDVSTDLGMTMVLMAEPVFKGKVMVVNVIGQIGESELKGYFSRFGKVYCESLDE